MICTVHTTLCYALNRRTLTLIIKSINIITLISHQHDNFSIDINTLTPNIHHHSLLTSLKVIKILTAQGILRNYDLITQMYIFCPLTKNFNVDEYRPLIVSQEFLQTVEIPLLELIYNTRYNHKLYNYKLIQNTPYEFSANTEKHKIIKALELLWPLLQTKYIIRLIAKLLRSSEIIHDVFPHGFFPDE